MRRPTARDVLERLRALATPDNLFFLAVAILASAPAWIVKYPPLEDLPFHASTLRQIHSYGDPAFGFQQTYYVNLGQTQYALYYVIADVFAYVLGVRHATVAMMCLYLGGTPLALRWLLRVLGKDERLAIFVVPLLVNTMFLIGLLPYVVAIPVMLCAWALSLRWFEKPTRALGIGLGVLAVGLFYSHVVMYALFGIGFAAMFPWRTPRSWLKAGVPVVPSLLVLAWWVFLSPQGKESFSAIGHGGGSAPAPLDQALSALPQWTCNVFRDQTDEGTWIALGLVVLLTLALAQGEKQEQTKPQLRAFVAVPLVCSLLYFVTGDMLGDVWLFSQRFPVPALITAIPFLRMPSRGMARTVVTALALLLASWSTVNVCKHFIQFQLEEVGELDGAMAHMEPNRHVAALIYDRASGIVNMSPFLHYGSWYQADKGGVVMFSNSGALYWPVRFREGHYPPPGTRPRLRWEWTPEQVPVRGELYPYYDYVLVRGDGFRPPPGTFHEAWHGVHWTVYAQD